MAKHLLTGSGCSIFHDGARRCLMGVMWRVRRAWEWITAKFAKRPVRTKLSFFVSDFVVIHGVMDILKESDVNEAHRKLLNPLHAIALDISEVTFGFAKLMFQKYIDDKQLVMNLIAQITDAPDIATLRLPFYVETPGLRNS